MERASVARLARGEEKAGGKMISVPEFHKEFLDRHDLVYPDSDYLRNKYKHIKFTNIPEAWVYQIDRFLQALCAPSKVTEVAQECGFLVVNGNIPEIDKEAIKKLDAQLRKLDIDLYEQLSEGIVLH
jgi:hypothetical protein